MFDFLNLIRIIKEIEPDEIYNLGAQSHVAVSFEAPEYTANCDALGTLRVLEAVRILGLKQKTKIQTQELESKTPGVLGFVKIDEKKSDETIQKKNENEIENNDKQKKIVQYPSNPNEHFKLAEGYLLNDINKAELAFKNFISTYKDNNRVVDAEYWLGRILFMQKKYSQAALAFAEFNAKYPDDKRYEQISLLIAEATVEYAPKDFICKILIQTFDSIDNPSAKFIKRIKQLKELNSCSNEW